MIRLWLVVDLVIAASLFALLVSLRENGRSRRRGGRDSEFTQDAQPAVQHDLLNLFFRP